MKRFAWGGLALVSFIGIFLGLPQIDIPDDVTPHYRYDIRDTYPDCREFCAPLAKTSGLGGSHEIALMGCEYSFDTIFECAPCPQGSECYNYNKAQDERYRAYMMTHVPEQPIEADIARRIMAGVCFFSMLGLVYRLTAAPDA